MEYIYAALLLHKLGKNVNEDNLKKVGQSAGAEVDNSKVKSLVASLKDVDITKELESASLVAVTPAGGAPITANGDTSEKKEEKPKEEEKAPAAEGLSALFG